jgi:hypothetical protein
MKMAILLLFKKFVELRSQSDFSCLACFECVFPMSFIDHALRLPLCATSAGKQYL